MPKYKSKS